MFPPDTAEIDSIVAEAWELGTTGITEEAEGTRIFFDAQSSLQQLRDAYSSALIEVRQESDRDWGTPLAADWEPLLIGKSLFVVSPWLRIETPPGRHRLDVESRMAFGTGRHETTQLILEALEAESLRNKIVVDVGCGSGILSAAALLWGASQVIACDTDADAVQEANLLVPGAVVHGSADSLETDIADVVVANLTASLIDTLASELNRICNSEGLLILSGFVSEKMPAAFKPDSESIRNDWCCWCLRPSKQNLLERVQEHPALKLERSWWLG